MQNHEKWVTLSEAQALLGVSRKTLYRYMDRKLLSYRKAANGRRYLSKDEIDTFLASHPVPTNIQNNPNTQDYSSLIRHLNALSDKIDRQNQLLEIMIELYKPETMRELMLKRKLQKHKSEL